MGFPRPFFDREAYERLGQAERFGVYIQEGVGHEMTLEMWQRLEAFFVAPRLSSVETHRDVRRA